MIAKLVQHGPNKTASSRVNSIPQDKKNVCSSDMTAGAAASSVNRSWKVPLQGEAQNLCVLVNPFNYSNYSYFPRIHTYTLSNH